MKRQIAVLVIVAALLMGLGLGTSADAAKKGKKAGKATAGKMMPGKEMKGKMGEEREEGMMGGGMCMMDGKGMDMMKNHMGMQMMLNDPKMQKKLGLTEDQKTKLKDIRSDAERKSIRGEADIKILRLDLMDLMQAKDKDAAKIDAKIDEIAAACASMAKLKVHAMMDCHNVLTPEQRKMMMEEKGKMGMDKMEGKDEMKKEEMKKGKMKKGKGKGKTMGKG